MKRAIKVLCIISVGIIGVLLPVATVYACCGMYPVITDDPVVTCCPGNEITISGTISSTEDTWGGTYAGSYTTEARMVIEVESPSGIITTFDVNEANGGLTNLVEGPDPNSAKWDFSVTYTPTETGTYNYAKTGYWTSAPTSGAPGGAEMGYTVYGEFTVEECEPSIDIKGGSCPNPFNPKSKGSVPVAILGVDVDAIDPASLILLVMSKNGEPYGPERVAGPLEGVGEIEDSTQPGDYDPADCYDCFDADDSANYNCDLDGDGTDDAYCGDGCAELVVKFGNRAITAAIAAAGGAEKGDCIDFEMLNAAGEVLGSDSVVVLKNIAAAP